MQFNAKINIVTKEKERKEFFMGEIIAIANQKGGVAKTTTTLNLTVALAKLKKKVLMVDLDPQSSLTISIGLEPENLKATIYNALINDIDVKKLILCDEAKFLYFIPSTIDLAAAEMELVAAIGREYKLKNALEPIKDDFDFILIDCPPSLGLLTINALTASDKILVPISPEYLSVRGFNLLEKTIDKVKQLNKSLELMGLFVTMYNSRTTHHKEIVTQLEKDYPVFKSKVKKSVKFPDAVLAGQAIIDFAPKFDGAVAYMNLAKEVINYGKK